MPGDVVFVTGATGFVGRRLVAALRQRGTPIRALTRDGSRLRGAQVEIVEGDVGDTGLLREALAGAAVAYYLVHSLGAADFASADADAARSFAEAARAARVGRLVYLGGIGHGDVSPHLASRREVGEILRDSGVPTVELRASVVIGEGSASYDAFRALAALPLAVLPDWIDNPSQPIAIEDVVAYLVEAGDIELDGSAVYEIGGAEAVPYRAILDALGATVAALPTPALATEVATLLKPLEPRRARVVTDLLDSLRFDTSVRDHSARGVFSVRPRSLHDAIASA